RRAGPDPVRAAGGCAGGEPKVEPAGRAGGGDGCGGRRRTRGAGGRRASALVRQCGDPQWGRFRRARSGRDEPSLRAPGGRDARRPDTMRRRGALRGALLPMLAVAVAACESPTIPAEPAAYDFTFATDPPMVLRWPAGTTIRVHVAGGEDPGRAAL